MKIVYFRDEDSRTKNELPKKSRKEIIQENAIQLIMANDCRLLRRQELERKKLSQTKTTK